MQLGYTNRPYNHLDHYRLSLFGENEQRDLWKKETKDIIILLKDEFKGCESKSVQLQEGRYRHMERLNHGHIQIDIAHSVHDLYPRDRQEWYIHNKGWIRITNQNKYDYRPHHEAIQRVEDVLAEYDGSHWWQAQYVELAVDTTDPKLGREMLLRSYPRYWQGDRPPKIKTNGLEQYFGNNEKRKQHHAYVRGDIYRWEIKVGRETLNSQGMNSYAQVMAKAPELIYNSIDWLIPKPDLGRHYTRIPVARAVNALQKKTKLATGQVIDKYFRRQRFPYTQIVN